MATPRLIVPMDAELLAWVGEQAKADDRSAASWARYLFTKMRRGEGKAGQRLPRVAQLEVQEPIYDTADQQSEEHSEPVDTEALIANALEDANIQPPPTALIPPPQGVRSLRKPQTPLTGGNASIDRYLGR